MARKAPPVRPLAKPSRSKDDYRISALKNPKKWTEKELRAEYSRLRAIANKRIARLEASEFAGTAAQVISYNKGKYVTLKSIGSKEQLVYLLKDVSKFVTAKSSTVAGQREIRSETISSLRASGFEGITEENYDEFGMFMEYMRTTTGTVFDSERAATLYEFSANAGISAADLIANYKTYDENLSKIEHYDIPEQDKGKITTSEELFNRLKIKDKVRHERVNLERRYEKVKKEARAGAGWSKKPRKSRE